MRSIVFPGMILASVALHGMIALAFVSARDETPRALPTQQGKNSIRMRATIAAAPRNPLPALEVKPMPVEPELPKPQPPELVKAARPVVKTPDPTLRPEKTVTPPPPSTELPLPPLDRPDMRDLPKRVQVTAAKPSRVHYDDPEMKPETVALAPVKSLELPLPALPVEPLKPLPVKPPEPVKPRPPLKEPPPQFEAIVKVAEVVSQPSPGSEESRGTEGDELPHALPTNPSPPYPARALAAGIEGKVVLRIKMDANGSPTSVTVHRSSGSAELDASALDTVSRSWRFQPARRGGAAVPYEATMTIEFYIRRR